MALKVKAVEKKIKFDKDPANHSVALPGLGTMRFGLRSKAVEDVNKVKALGIFQASLTLLSLLRILTLSKSVTTRHISSKLDSALAAPSFDVVEIRHDSAHFKQA